MFGGFLKPKPRQDAAWVRGMQPRFDEEKIASISRIDGKLPVDLKGNLYRIGPGKHQAGKDHYQHWFDGDGMVCHFRMDGQRVSFQNRYVRTPWFEREQKAGKSLYMNFGTPMFGGLVNAARHRAKNPANTNAIMHNGKLLALWEGGRPFAVDPETLDTLGEEDFGGLLGDNTLFSAHPHHDPDTGAIYNIGTMFGKVPSLALWKVDKNGRGNRVTKIRMKRPCMVHDFGLSETHAIVMAGPLYLEPRKMLGCLFGLRSMVDCFTWHPDEPMIVYVVDRETGEQVNQYELPAGMVIHVANAFESGGETVVDAAIFDGDPMLTVKQAFAGEAPDAAEAIMYRVTLRRDGTWSREPLTDVSMEFPRTDDRRTGKDYKYAYGVELADGQFLSSRLVKAHTDGSRTEIHDFGTDCIAGEPVFAPRPGSRNEDDGWLVSVVYDASDHHSFLGIVPANGLGGSDIRVHLPFHTPLGFHGNFYPA